MRTQTHTLVAFHIPKGASDAITFAKNMVQSMSNNPLFLNPNPPLATVEADIAAADAAETTAKTRARGAADARNAKLEVLINDLRALGSYVQSIAATHPPESQPAVIEGSGLHVRAKGSHPKQPIDAGMAPAGIVSLHAHAAAKGKHAAYEWQISADGGKTWTGLPITTVAHTAVSGLAIGTTQMFRVRITIADQVGDWTQAISLFIH